MAFALAMLLVFGMIGGNLLWLRPSGAEKALIAQREYAKTLGFAVYLRQAPEWLAQPAGARIVGQYRWLHPMQVAHVGRWRWHAGLGNWQPIENPDAWLKPAPWPTPAPDGWLGLDVQIDGVVFYWREDGQKASVDQILSCLHEVSA